MTAMNPTAQHAITDADLWQEVRAGSMPAFESLVRRHQSAVCAVAYSACGDLALSEDVAQETFWAAWRGRDSLADPRRLPAWLCGIARNLGHNARRTLARPVPPVARLATEPDPATSAAEREEAALVWESLEQIPATYRDPLVLYYREQHSVAQVAAALDLSEDAVKQRLSRGRAMLRDRVAELVEGTLRRTRPGSAFTVAVLSGLTATTVTAKTALAGAGGPVAKLAAGAGVTGAALGSVAGLAGGWLGTWLPAQLAESRQERDYLLRIGRRMLMVSVVFLVALVIPALNAGRMGAGVYLTYWLLWMLTFTLYAAIEGVRVVRAVKALRAQGNLTPNDAPLRAAVEGYNANVVGRVYRSRSTLLGLPLVDVNVRDPMMPGPAHEPGRGTARGWIAVGDVAHGVLFAAGGRARGFIAVGGRTVGVISLGGVAVGLIAIGGVALGALALGGVGIGVIGLGGLGVGWQAAGGGAVAWDLAAGGGAAAVHAAFGGAAVARDFAVGGAAWAEHVNDEAAKAVVNGHPLTDGMLWYSAHAVWPALGIVGLALALSLGLMNLMYRRRPA